MISKYFLQTRDGINLCGLRFTIHEFRQLEPTLLDLPMGVTTKTYTPGVCHYDSGHQHILYDKFWADGDRYISRYPEFERLWKKLHSDDAAIEKQVIEEKLKRQSYDIRRKAEYPTTDELVMAMWELLVEDRPELAAELQEKRLKIKQKHPEGS